MSRRHLISLAFALYSFLTLALSSTITPAPTPTPTSSYRDPLLGGRTLRSGSVNGTTTIWTAYYSDASIAWQTAEGTVTDEVTSLIWSETNVYTSPAGLLTICRTASCQVSSGVRTWCTNSWASIANGTTIDVSNEALSGVAVSEFPLPTKTVSDGLLEPLNTNPILTPIPTPTSSSKINASALYRALEC